MYISDNLESAGVWEEYIVAEVGDLLSRDPDLHLIDAGANIGVYSLYAAKLGRKVVAVEPFMDNVLRLQKVNFKLNFRFCEYYELLLQVKDSLVTKLK